MSQQSLTHNAVENLNKLDPRFRQIDMYAAQNGQKPTTPPGVLVLTERNSSISTIVCRSICEQLCTCIIIPLSLSNTQNDANKEENHMLPD
jgi:hypothetical protein